MKIIKREPTKNKKSGFKMLKNKKYFEKIFKNSLSNNKREKKDSIIGYLDNLINENNHKK